LICRNLNIDEGRYRYCSANRIDDPISCANVKGQGPLATVARESKQ